MGCLLLRLCCTTPFREEDSGEWIEPIKKKKSKKSSRGGGGVAEEEKPNEKAVRWSNMLENMERCTIEDLERNSIINDSDLTRKVNSFNHDEARASARKDPLSKSLGMTSMTSLFSEDSVLKTIKDSKRGSAMSMGSYLGGLCEEGERGVDAVSAANSIGTSITDPVTEASVAGSKKEVGNDES
mmetsp:Transcript_38594/g.82344  ORF Transcript_38594/g.82344 Transcript_38594/m.82344 type:complete len:184 (+) Transcript_38594:3-554(+)